MNGMLISLAEPGRYAVFHALTLACALTGGIVLLTAGDLGPLAPLLLAMGLYLTLFAVLAESALGLRRIAAALAARRLGRVGQVAAP